MAHLSLYVILVSLLTSSVAAQPPPPLHAAEQESVYQFMESVNSEVAWRALFPDDLCSSGPHGVVCDYFSDGTAHVTELSFGYISDYSANPPCNARSTLNPSLLAPLTHLSKLMFYKCFNHSKTPFPYFNGSSSLEELVFIDNPGLTGSMEGRIGNLKRLRTLIVSGTSASGGLSDGFGEFPNLEQLTLSRNRFQGQISRKLFVGMKKLKVLDLSQNGFEGNVPESMGYASELLKIDLSHNKFCGRIPERLFKGLKSVEVVDLSYNKLEGEVPQEIGELEFVKELNLEGNNLSGTLPFSLSKLGGMLRLQGNFDLCIHDSANLILNNNSILKICRHQQPYVSKTALFHHSCCPPHHAISLVFLFLGFWLL